ncbi:MAG TPA: ammonium transporter, partial [Actinomycetota bacterium]
MRKRTRILVMLSMVLVAWLSFGGVGHAQAADLPQACGGKITGVSDPCGDKTGTAVDITGNPNPTLQEVADQAGKDKIGINFTWTLVTAFLVMFMQAGFALVETGFCRRKNSAHVIMTNFMIYALGILGFFLVGYALMFGGVGHLAQLGGTPPLTGEAHVAGWGIFGTKGFGFNGIYDVGVMAHFLF